MGIRVMHDQLVNTIAFESLRCETSVFRLDGRDRNFEVFDCHARGIPPCRLLSELLLSKRNHEGVSIRHHISA